MNARWLACTISPGQFPTEYAVSGTQQDGTPYSLFAPADAVAPPDGAAEGPGHVRVQLVDRRAGLALVRLPAQTFENGFHVTVSESDLRADVPQPAAV